MNTIDLEEVTSRWQETGELTRGVFVTAFGGKPLSSMEEAREAFCLAMGESALLTYMNPLGRTRAEMSEKILRMGHDWAGNWINVTLTFFQYPAQVQTSFARDRRFWLSWSEVTNQVWSATASVKDWRRYTGHSDDKSFEKETRRAMRDARALLRLIDESYFE